MRDYPLRILPFLLLVTALCGVSASMAWGGDFMQPDWALAILLAALLARRGNWIWVLPALLVHDLILYWSAWGVFPLAMLFPLMLNRLDAQLGAALPQRIALMIIISSPILWHGSSMIAWVLTLLLCVPCWYILVDLHEQHA